MSDRHGYTQIVDIVVLSYFHPKKHLYEPRRPLGVICYKNWNGTTSPKPTTVEHPHPYHKFTPSQGRIICLLCTLGGLLETGVHYPDRVM